MCDRLRTAVAHVSGVGRRLAAADDGQDLIEYALLTAFIGLAALSTMNTLGQTIAAAYAAWDSGVQALWDPPAPGAAGS